MKHAIYLGMMAGALLAVPALPAQEVRPRLTIQAHPGGARIVGITPDDKFSDYREKDGLKHYRKISALHDGKKFVEGTVTEIEFFEKLDPKVLAKP